MAYKEGKTLVIRVPRGGYRFFPTAVGGLRAEDALNAVLQWFLEHATTVAVTKPSAGRKLEEAVAAGEAAALGPNPGAARKLKPRPEAMDVADPDPRRVLVGDFRKRAFPAGRLVAAIGSWAACFAIAQAAGADVCSSWIVALIGFGIGWLLAIRIGS